MALFQPDRPVVMPLIQLLRCYLCGNSKPVFSKPAVSFIDQLRRRTLDTADCLVDACPKEQIRSVRKLGLTIFDELGFDLLPVQTEQGFVTLFDETFDHRHYHNLLSFKSYRSSPSGG